MMENLKILYDLITLDEELEQKRSELESKLELQELNTVS